MQRKNNFELYVSRAHTRRRQRERERGGTGRGGGCRFFVAQKNMDLRENLLCKCGRVGRDFFVNNGNLLLRLTTGITKKAFTVWQKGAIFSYVSQTRDDRTTRPFLFLDKLIASVSARWRRNHKKPPFNECH